VARESEAEDREQGRSFLILGNLSCLDLVNTEAMSEGKPVDLLAGFADLVAWLARVGVLAEPAAQAARDRWEGRAEATAVFRRAVTLRASLRQMVERLAQGKGPTEEQVGQINRVLAERPAYRQLVRMGRGFGSTLVAERESVMHLLVPVAESAAWLVEHGDLSLLRRCENPRCILYFYDTTRNRRRRWCSMAGCGSRAKAAAYYRRKRGARRHH
jgi:predicted RNA-binding Zn ribbon-like protein